MNNWTAATPRSHSVDRKTDKRQPVRRSPARSFQRAHARGVVHRESPRLGTGPNAGKEGAGVCIATSTHRGSPLEAGPTLASMTPILIFLAFGLVLAAGWALVRMSKGPPVGAIDGTGDRILLDRSPVGTLLLDPALRVTWANDTFCDLFGLIRNDLIGRGFADVVQQELKDLVTEPDAVEAALMSAYTSAAKASPFEFAVRVRDERDERLVEHNCQVIEQKPLEGGRVAYFVDVTPRERGAVTGHTREVHLHELDRILVKLARRSSGGGRGRGVRLARGRRTGRQRMETRSVGDMVTG
jgi:PAS domain S-box-containing protein